MKQSSVYGLINTFVWLKLANIGKGEEGPCFYLQVPFSLSFHLKAPAAIAIGLGESTFKCINHWEGNEKKAEDNSWRAWEIAGHFVRNHGKDGLTDEI